ncbi:uncharacterized protein BCR38DRAFT_142559 [Pseudomassariella vexata]|uniref:Uncharacterized protein n=1 Tax=Pseudomassariella vexata TaxID=1141098 RepID=A0A1Y2EC73_9PEZI|nr:uncharacterized protein BCR38DRAFT_142559 [Pseudomassariella vexata]ORY69007.1 hypothetical protein BCR38DRAFT_142559 [Pseudomassariella vexata]
MSLLALNLPQPKWQGVPQWGGDKRWHDFIQGRITVNENSWLNLFAKPRWYDLRPAKAHARATDTIRYPFPQMEEHDTPWWTVDNPIIWEQVSISIELANRILLRLCQERNPWINTLLFAKSLTWAGFDMDVCNIWST